MLLNFNMLQKQRKFLFRGPTSEKVIQTIDIGTKDGESWLRRQSQRFTQRHYVGVDPRFRETIVEGRLELKPRSATEALQEAIRNREQARHINVDMPLNIGLELYNFPRVFQLARKVLFPQGKIFITSEDVTTLKNLMQQARESGFKALAIKTIDKEGAMRTRFMKLAFKKYGKVFQLVLVNPRQLK